MAQSPLSVMMIVLVLASAAMGAPTPAAPKAGSVTKPAAGGATATSSGTAAAVAADCALVNGCSACVGVTYDAAAAAQRFAVLQAQRAAAQAARAAERAGRLTSTAAARAAVAGVSPPATTADVFTTTITTTTTTAGRRLSEAASADALDGDEALAAAEAGRPLGAVVATAPSCTACSAGFKLVQKSIRGRPPMGRCGALGV